MLLSTAIITEFIECESSHEHSAVIILCLNHEHSAAMILCLNHEHSAAMILCVAMQWEKSRCERMAEM